MNEPPSNPGSDWAESRFLWAVRTCERIQLRLTPVRKAILRLLASSRLPVTLEMISQGDGVRGERELTTVYRTLVMLREAEVVRLVGMPHKQSYFSLNAPEQQGNYLICRNCGAIEEISLPMATLVTVQQIAAEHGYASASLDCELHGICAECIRLHAGGAVVCKLVN